MRSTSAGPLGGPSDLYSRICRLLAGTFQYGGQCGGYSYNTGLELREHFWLQNIAFDIQSCIRTREYEEAKTEGQAKRKMLELQNHRELYEQNHEIGRRITLLLLALSSLKQVGLLSFVSESDIYPLLHIIYRGLSVKDEEGAAETAALSLLELLTVPEPSSLYSQQEFNGSFSESFDILKAMMDPCASKLFSSLTEIVEHGEKETCCENISTSRLLIISRMFFYALFMYSNFKNAGKEKELKRFKNVLLPIVVQFCEIVKDRIYSIDANNYNGVSYNKAKSSCRFETGVNNNLIDSGCIGSGEGIEMGTTTDALEDVLKANDLEISSDHVPEEGSTSDEIEEDTIFGMDNLFVQSPDNELCLGYVSAIIFTLETCQNNGTKSELYQALKETVQGKGYNRGTILSSALEQMHLPLTTHLFSLYSKLYGVILKHIRDSGAIVDIRSSYELLEMVSNIINSVEETNSCEKIKYWEILEEALDIILIHLRNCGNEPEKSFPLERMRFLVPLSSGFSHLPNHLNVFSNEEEKMKNSIYCKMMEIVALISAVDISDSDKHHLFSNGLLHSLLESLVEILEKSKELLKPYISKIIVNLSSLSSVKDILLSHFHDGKSTLFEKVLTILLNNKRKWNEDKDNRGGYIYEECFNDSLIVSFVSSVSKRVDMDESNSLKTLLVRSEFINRIHRLLNLSERQLLQERQNYWPINAIGCRLLSKPSESVNTHSSVALLQPEDIWRRALADLVEILYTQEGQVHIRENAEELLLDDILNVLSPVSSNTPSDVHFAFAMSDAAEALNLLGIEPNKLRDRKILEMLKKALLFTLQADFSQQYQNTSKNLDTVFGIEKTAKKIAQMKLTREVERSEIPGILDASELNTAYNYDRSRSSIVSPLSKTYSAKGHLFRAAALILSTLADSAKNTGRDIILLDGLIDRALVSSIPAKEKEVLRKVFEKENKSNVNDSLGGEKIGEKEEFKFFEDSHLLTQQKENYCSSSLISIILLLLTRERVLNLPNISFHATSVRDQKKFITSSSQMLDSAGLHLIKSLIMDRTLISDSGDKELIEDNELNALKLGVLGEEQDFWKIFRSLNIFLPNPIILVTLPIPYSPQSIQLTFGTSTLQKLLVACEVVCGGNGISVLDPSRMTEFSRCLTINGSKSKNLTRTNMISESLLLCSVEEKERRERTGKDILLLVAFLSLFPYIAVQVSETSPLLDLCVSYLCKLPELVFGVDDKSQHSICSTKPNINGELLLSAFVLRSASLSRQSARLLATVEDIFPILEAVVVALFSDRGRKICEKNDLAKAESRDASLSSLSDYQSNISQGPGIDQQAAGTVLAELISEILLNAAGEPQNRKLIGDGETSLGSLLLLTGAATMHNGVILPLEQDLIEQYRRNAKKWSLIHQEHEISKIPFILSDRCIIYSIRTLALLGSDTAFSGLFLSNPNYFAVLFNKLEEVCKMAENKAEKMNVGEKQLEIDVNNIYPDDQDLNFPSSVPSKPSHTSKSMELLDSKDIFSLVINDSTYIEEVLPQLIILLVNIMGSNNEVFTISENDKEPDAGLKSDNIHDDRPGQTNLLGSILNKYPKLCNILGRLLFVASPTLMPLILPLISSCIDISPNYVSKLKLGPKNQSLLGICLSFITGILGTSRVGTGVMDVKDALIPKGFIRKCLDDETIVPKEYKSMIHNIVIGNSTQQLAQIIQQFSVIVYLSNKNEEVAEEKTNRNVLAASTLGIAETSLTTLKTRLVFATLLMKMARREDSASILVYDPNALPVILGVLMPPDDDEDLYSGYEKLCRTYQSEPGDVETYLVGILPTLSRYDKLKKPFLEVVGMLEILGILLLHRSEKYRGAAASTLCNLSIDSECTELMMKGEIFEAIEFVARGEVESIDLGNHIDDNFIVCILSAVNNMLRNSPDFVGRLSKASSVYALVSKLALIRNCSQGIRKLADLFFRLVRDVGID